jgi:hypothetical protein
MIKNITKVRSRFSLYRSTYNKNISHLNNGAYGLENKSVHIEWVRVTDGRLMTEERKSISLLKKYSLSLYARQVSI